MKVLSLYYTHKPGGFCKRLYRLLNALTKRKVEVHYLSLDKPPSELSSQVIWHQIPFPVTKRTGILFWIIFTVWCPLFTAYQAFKIKPDRYLIFGAFYSTMLIVARIVHNAPSVLFLRSLVFEINKITKKPALLRFLSNLLDKTGILSATRVICMTRAMKHKLFEFLGREMQVEILPNDLPDLKATIPPHSPNNQFTILTAGVLDQRKNISLILAALSEATLKDSNPIRLIVAGTGPLLESLRKEAHDKNLLNIEFPGWCDSLEPYFAQTDLYLHPSLHEGMPNSVLEALSHAIPVLLADTPEMRELIGSELALFKADDFKALAYRLNELRNAPGKLKELSQACHKHSEKLRFDWDEKGSALVTA